MTAQKLTDFAPWPTDHEGATAEVMALYYLACAAWHSGRLNAVADLPRAEFLASTYASTLAYATAQLLRRLRKAAPDVAAQLAQHIYEVVASGEAGEWIWEALQETGRSDAGDIFTAGERSVPRGPMVIRSEVEGLQALAAELRARADRAQPGITDGDRLWRLGILVDADWLEARAAKIARGGASDGE